MSRSRRRRPPRRSLFSFLITWIILSAFLPLYEISSFLIACGVAAGVAYLVGRAFGKGMESGKRQKQEEAEFSRAARQREAEAPRAEVRTQPTRKTSQRVQAAVQSKTASERTAVRKPEKKSYGPEIDPIIEEGNRALAEMGRLYMSIQDPEVKAKINELMRITDKITQDAIADPADIPQIKKFLNYYLPTTIKLLNSYDRMSSVGVEGENLDKSMKNINEMLDAAIAAFKKRLDSLFANQALDIETDIDVMNQMLAREGLIDNNDFQVMESGGH